ncbi:ice-binding family protein [Flavobacterium yafengii]|uniref:Ice-binding family protein n=1 Tax=Flavobacterium yafengii TaxID=3041253 RepID=A0AAW6THI5_9FLAO|nr:ice-binding family protein [Flavobacterium yafengii]MDI5949075.1 ice-binding family protein [Flavobacterium yafengii]MDI6044929.1 ice-binding family protein [Flavobacterium yafengii]
MKNNVTFLLILFLQISGIINAQVGIGTTNPEVSSILDIHSTNKGFLLPRLTTAQRDAISLPATGLLIYNTTTSIFNFYNSGWKDFNTGLVLPINGGTGIANSNASTLALPGGFATTLTTNGLTDVTLPMTGTLYGTQTGSITSAQIQNSSSDETGTGKLVFSESPSFTNIPLAPTAIVGTNTTQLATTAFVMANSNNYYSVNNTGDLTTTSPTDVVIPGMSISTSTGTYAVAFNGQYTIIPSNKTAQAAIDLQSVYTQLNSIAVTNTTHAPVFGGETLLPGVYSIAAAGSAAGIITLDAQGDPNALFIIKFGEAFSTGATTTIVLANSASAANVFWLAKGAIGLGASTVMKGTLLSKEGAVSLGANCIIDGRVLTGSGAIGIDTSTITKTSNSPYVNLGALFSFALFTSSGGVGNTGVSTINGDIGTNLGAITGFETARVNGALITPGIVSAMATFSIYQNGVLIANSSRTRVSSINTVDVSLQAIADVSVGQDIDVRWNIDAGTLKLGSRILTLINVR